jgi:hypothetical protein
MDETAPSVVERMCQHRRRLDPLEPMCGERQRPEQRRRHRERMNGRADVVDEARERELCRASAAAGESIRFEDDDLSAGLRDDDRGRETVWS